MHQTVMEWVGGQVRDRQLVRPDGHVLEVGSLDVNGSVRPLFEGVGSYWGVDIRPGPGVDEVVRAGVPFPFGRSFSVVVCTEVLEHDPRPWVTVREMARVCRPGGVLLVTARGFNRDGCYPVHDYPDDLWRFSMSGMVELMVWAGVLVDEVTADPGANGVFVAATKPLTDIPGGEYGRHTY
jgi:SAM-dependent methyltransferase